MTEFIELTTPAGRKVRLRARDTESAYQGVPAVGLSTEVQMLDGSWRSVNDTLLPLDANTSGSLPNGETPIGFDVGVTEHSNQRFRVRGNRLRIDCPNGVGFAVLDGNGHLAGVDILVNGYPPLEWVEWSVGMGGFQGSASGVRGWALPNGLGQITPMSFYNKDRQWIGEHPISNPNGGPWPQGVYIRIAPKSTPNPDTDDPRIQVECPSDVDIHEIRPWAYADNSSFLSQNWWFPIAQKTNGVFHGPPQIKDIGWLGLIRNSDPEHLHVVVEFHGIAPPTASSPELGSGRCVTIGLGAGVYGHGSSDPGAGGIAYKRMIAEEELIVIAPSGAKWKIQVASDGTLSTVAAPAA